MKNIYLYAFIDTNFGDNLFVHTIAKRYPEHKFHMVVNDTYRKSYELLASFERNIVLVETADEEFLNKMDGMLIVGGDMFGNGIYTTMTRQIQTIRKNGGFVSFMGISLFKDYKFITKVSLRRMFNKANHIVVREDETYNQLRKLAPKVPVTSAADMAFTVDVSEVSKLPVQKGLLGISVRKKIPRNAPDAYDSYCKNVARATEAYLKESKNNKVRFLALSKGVFDDEAVSREIIQLCSKEYMDRIEIATFDGDVDGYVTKMQECESLLCTRFHALVFAILLEKPFVPVIYEDKMTRLLNEIGYDGLRLYYEKEFDIKKTLDGYNKNFAFGDKLEQYFVKANKYFEKTDEFFN